MEKRKLYLSGCSVHYTQWCVFNVFCLFDCLILQTAMYLILGNRHRPVPVVHFSPGDTVTVTHFSRGTIVPVVIFSPVLFPEIAGPAEN